MDVYMTLAMTAVTGSHLPFLFWIEVKTLRHPSNPMVTETYPTACRMFDLGVSCSVSFSLAHCLKSTAFI